ncbi:MAG: DUF6318 family protein [Actinomycetaceae bacterium]|nr:DUF6318 family protein [Actinomycetaceae bacterium]
MGQDLAEELHRKRFDYTNLYPVLGVIAVVVIAWGGWFASGKIREHNLAENKRIGQEYNESLKSPAGPEKAGGNKETVTSKENDAAIDVPVLPQAATQNTLEGAKALAEYWVETYNYLLDTGESTPMTEICHPGALGCSQLINELHDLQSAGKRIEGADHAAAGTTCFNEIPEEVTCIFVLEYTDSATYDSKNNLLRVDPAGSYEWAQKIRFIDGKHVIYEAGKPTYLGDGKK